MYVDAGQLDVTDVTDGDRERVSDSIDDGIGTLQFLDSTLFFAGLPHSVYTPGFVIKLLLCAVCVCGALFLSCEHITVFNLLWARILFSLVSKYSRHVLGPLSSLCEGLEFVYISFQNALLFYCTLHTDFPVGSTDAVARYVSIAQITCV